MALTVPRRRARPEPLTMEAAADACQEAEG
jgi:hypothetical protein